MPRLKLRAAAAQVVFDVAISKPVSLRQRAATRLANLVYRKVLSTSSITVRSPVCGIDLVVPVGHGLPWRLRTEPNDTMCLGRAAAVVAAKYGDSVFLDVGANIGDSAAVMRGHGVTNQILCIEGVRDFFDVLVTNAASLGNIKSVCTFVDVKSGTVGATVRVLATGNAAIYTKPRDYAAESAPFRHHQVKFETLADVFDRESPGAHAGFVKTDIEGLDIPVLLASKDLLAKHRPTIFMELFVMTRDETSKGVTVADLWAQLRGLGYAKALYWYRSTDFICMLDLHRDERAIEDIHDLLRDHPAYLYADVCLVHECDLDIANKIHEGEKEFARSHRQNRAP